jgi:hypothetical protein
MQEKSKTFGELGQGTVVRSNTEWNGVFEHYIILKHYEHTIGDFPPVPYTQMISAKTFGKQSVKQNLELGEDWTIVKEYK